MMLLSWAVCRIRQYDPVHSHDRLHQQQRQGYLDELHHHCRD